MLPDLVDDPAQPLFEVPAVACAGDDPGELELDDPLAGQRLRDFLVDDALGDALHDGGLADAGLADQYRIVLAAPGQHLDGLLDLIVPADDRVHPPFPGHRGQVAAELVQRGGRRRPAVLAGRAALALTGEVGLLQRLRRDPLGGQHPAGHGLRVDREREQDVLGADVGGPERVRDPVRVQQRPLRARRQLRCLAARAAAPLLLLDLAGERIGIRAGSRQHLPGGLQPGRSPQQVLGVQIGAAALSRQRGRRADELARWRAHQPGDIDALAWTQRTLPGAVQTSDEVVERAGAEALRSVVTTAHGVPTPVGLPGMSLAPASPGAGQDRRNQLSAFCPSTPVATPARSSRRPSVT